MVALLCPGRAWMVAEIFPELESLGGRPQPAWEMENIICPGPQEAMELACPRTRYDLLVQFLGCQEATWMGRMLEESREQASLM